MYLVMGASGFIGSYLIKNILDMTNDKIIAIARDTVAYKNNTRLEWLFGDVREGYFLCTINEKIKIERDVKIAYLIGVAPPEAVLKNPRTSFDIDVITLARFVNSIENISSFYYLSSEAVFSGGSFGRKFMDNDMLAPMNLYGRHKVAAEAIVSAKGFNTIRFPVMIGPSLVPHKPQFFDIILSKLKNDDRIEMFTDSVRSLTDFDTATRALVSLMENPNAKQYPAVNIVCDKALSKYDLGLMIAEKYGFDKSLVIPALQSDSNVFKDKRENVHLLDNTLLKSLLGVEKLELKI